MGSDDGATVDADLRAGLLARAVVDQEVRAEVGRRWPGGTVIDNDDPLYLRWCQADADNTAWLRGVIDATGWPTVDRVGDDGADAAWLLAQHADADPVFQRRCLQLMTDQVERGQASPALLAYLVDHVAIQEGRPQTYGTQHDWRDGVAVPKPIRDPEGVDLRRAEVGLLPLADTTAGLNHPDDAGDP